MPNVLIVGATGYLGLSLAKSLLQTGAYTVWGTARSPEKAKTLLVNEVSPVEQDITNSEALSEFIATNSIDIVVDASSAYEQSGQILAGVVNASKARQEALAKENIISPKLGFVYISGTWVHGSPATRVSDLAPVGSKLSAGKPATAVAWRPAHEQAILAARDTLDVAIARPGALYGRSSWVFDTWWRVLLEARQTDNTATVQVPADRAARTGIVHVDDAAAAIRSIIDRLDGRLGSWPVFDLVTETLSVVEIMEAAKAVLEVKAPLEYTGTHGNPFLEALSLICNTNASHARIVLGWEPKRVEFLLNVAVFVKAWQASQ
ncbi:NAD dependent epimerase/dehydratase family protein [Aspergillus steynii IBT 23096]|uniref:NAD dependent epimerase/dehydratase family protein n=1 Tax=Aspergillus steynii IBT 23096 TaxID=1392250 RepID=A0A2I2G3G5_9EURO|nr:NAD dependent epimerase/dehydratase family protein [Aspergillus steynii IBT 23096]PLB47422.1 NAD dependent epimerase/dehydratase family protein [Aspergillus steynii IBT 23096]